MGSLCDFLYFRALWYRTESELVVLLLSLRYMALFALRAMKSDVFVLLFYEMARESIEVLCWSIHVDLLISPGLCAAVCEPAPSCTVGML